MVFNKEKKVYLTKDGLVFKVINDKLVLLNPTKSKNGYLYIRGTGLHRLMWETFKGQIPNGFQIHHIDGNKENNNLENLECENSLEHQRKHKLGLKHSEQTKNKQSKAIKLWWDKRRGIVYDHC